jgi:hypothetical protein
MTVTVTVTSGAEPSASMGERNPRELLGPELHAELLASQVTGYDEVFCARLTWTLGFIRDRSKIAKGGIGGSAASGGRSTPATTPAPT